MTREEAFQNRPLILSNISDGIKIDEFITKIYDDFENRHCEQCNKYINHGFGWVECDLIAKEYCIDIYYCDNWEKINDNRKIQ